MKSITVLTEKLEKSAEKPAEEPVAEEPAVEPEAEVTEVDEEVAKSAEKPVEEEEEELEGKSVEFISKSNGIPEIEPQTGKKNLLLKNHRKKSSMLRSTYQQLQIT
ncbi:hypothetical protein QCM8_65 [Bacillus phage QCM8]|nr:hypothetical protein QCM8_65 [Bacillus phage QCM8]